MTSFESAGEVVDVQTELPWAGQLVSRATGHPADSPTGVASVRVRVEASTAAFDLSGLRPVTRGAYSDGQRTVLHNAGGSGFDLAVDVDSDLSVIARYRPSYPLRAANRLLAGRFALLAGQMLVHYPVLWRAGWRGRVPLHASVLSSGAGAPMLVGPGGVGKSTVLLRAVASGAVATSDNLCCADADAGSCFGVVEPMRTDSAPGARGQRTSHDRMELPFTSRVSELAPDRLVVLERGPHTEISELDAGEAARALVAGTYAAGELRRYWAFAATMALATGRGPAHPLIGEVAACYAARLPCRRVRVGDGDAMSLAQLCGEGVQS
jgi:hypothetical protein